MATFQHKPTQEPTPSRRGRTAKFRRGAAVALAVIGTIASSCAGPASVPAGIEIPVEPITLDIPEIEVDLGICAADIDLPPVVIDGLVFAIPAVEVDPDMGTLSVPDVILHSPARNDRISGIQASCFDLPPASLDVILTVPEISAGGSITVDFENRVILIEELSFEVVGGQVAIPDLGNLTIPLPEVVLPLDGISVPF